MPQQIRVRRNQVLLALFTVTGCWLLSAVSGAADPAGAPPLLTLAIANFSTSGVEPSVGQDAAALLLRKPFGRTSPV